MPKLYDEYTDRNGNFNFNGEDSRDFGAIITKAPDDEIPARKSQAFAVPGRNGVILHQEDAWEDVARVYNVALAVDEAADYSDMIDEFLAWLNSVKGYQRLEDNFKPDIFRLAYYNGGGEVKNNFLQYGEASVPFTCRPEKFLKSGETPRPLTNGGTIENPTRYTAKPLLYIQGSGNVSITINGATITAQLTDYLYIDCESMNAYRQASENMNNKISGDFPTLAPGQSTISTSGTITAATITPRFYTI